MARRPNNRILYRRQLYHHLRLDVLYGRDILCTRDTGAMRADYESLCLECGDPIHVGEWVVHAHRDVPDMLTQTGVVHDACPTPAEQLSRLFNVDGDIIQLYFAPGAARTQNCWICDAPGVSYRIANPDIYSPQIAAYICAMCLVKTEAPPSLEERRRRAHDSPDGM